MCEDTRVHLLPELTRGVVGCVAVARQEGVEQQASTRSQAVGGELEHSAQVVGGPEIGYHLGEHNQLIILPQIGHGLEDVTLDDAHVK